MYNVRTCTCPSTHCTFRVLNIALTHLKNNWCRIGFYFIRPAEYFQIISRLNGLSLDIYKADPTEGTKVITWTKFEPPEDWQTWYEDRYGYIRSKLNNMVLDASGELTPRRPFVILTYT